MKPADRLHRSGVDKFLADPSFRKLARIAESWGGKLQFMNNDTVLKCVDRDTRRARSRPSQQCYYSDPGLSDDGLVVTTHWRRKVIYISPELYPAPKKVLGTLIHEMGHVFADPKPPDDADELEWLGWEVALARWANCYEAWNSWKDGFALERKKDLPGDLAALWEMYAEGVCRGACSVCCGRARETRVSPDELAEWGDLSDKGKQELIKNRLRRAVALGIVDQQTKRPRPITERHMQ